MAESEPRIEVVEAVTADPQELSAFLDEAFGPRKSRFLIEHGNWWHRGSGGRFVATYDGVIAGYRGMIPALCLVAGRETPAIWAVDLYVSPRFRGRGLQRLLDRKVLEGSQLRMSFPNKTAAQIYSRQGYGLRDDLRLLTVPVFPKSHPGVLGRSGSRGRAARAGATVASPIAAVYRAWASRYRPIGVEAVDSLDPSEGEEIFRRHAAPDMITTLRSAEFLRWRYLEAPYRAELAFFLGGPSHRRTQCAIVRYRPTDDRIEARVLDMFGDLEDEAGLADLTRTIVRDAVLRGASDVRALVGTPKLRHIMRSAGFLTSRPYLFRWLADDKILQESLRTAKLHWTLGDSDNDAPR